LLGLFPDFELFHPFKAFIAQILCFVDRASRYNHAKENQLDAQLITPYISSTSTCFGRI